MKATLNANFRRALHAGLHGVAWSITWWNGWRGADIVVAPISERGYSMHSGDGDQTNRLPRDRIRCILGAMQLHSGKSDIRQTTVVDSGRFVKIPDQRFSIFVPDRDVKDVVMLKMLWCWEMRCWSLDGVCKIEVHGGLELYLNLHYSYNLVKYIFASIIYTNL